MSTSKSYKQLSQELEDIINKLQSNDLDVDEVINEYQKGITLVDHLEKHLKEAKNKITKIVPRNAKPKK